MEAGRELLQIVDAATAAAQRLSGAWVVCRLGCHECCEGPFEISEVDAARIGGAWLAMRGQLPAVAQEIGERARAYSGGDEESCPALDPDTGGCLLYEARPLTCRTFGPAIRHPGGVVSACHLNYEGASEEEILACSVELDVEALEMPLLSGGQFAEWRRCGTVAAAIVRAADRQDFGHGVAGL